MMKRLAWLSPLIFLGLLSLLLWHPWRPTPPSDQPPPTPRAATTPPEPRYTYGEASADGIGKFFMGREIAQVMGHRGMAWLDRPSRERQESPTSAIEALQLPADTVIADIGAGSGYYTFRLAPKVPHGEVIAVDIQPEMLTQLEITATAEGVTNVRPHLGRVDDIGLEPESIDAALLVDAYHEFSHPAEMMASIRRALRPGGQVFLLEYRAEDDSVPIKPLHKMSEAQVRREMQSLGLRFIANEDFLPWQHFLVFEKPATTR